MAESVRPLRGDARPRRRRRGRPMLRLLRAGARRPAGDRSATAACLRGPEARRLGPAEPRPRARVPTRQSGRARDAATARRDAEAVGCWDETWLHVDVNMPQPPGHFMALAGAAGPHGAPLEAHTLRWNLTEPLPFGDPAFGAREHALEHLPPRDVVGFLAEAWRAGRRYAPLSTPDLAKFAVACVDRATDRRFLDERAALFPPRDCPWRRQLLGASRRRRGVMRNGHTFIWDVESLGFALEAGGVPRPSTSTLSDRLPPALRTADMPIRDREVGRCKSREERRESILEGSSPLSAAKQVGAVTTGRNYFFWQPACPIDLFGPLANRTTVKELLIERCSGRVAPRAA